MAKLGAELVIHAGNAHRHAVDAIVDGERRARGLVPRDWSARPAGCYASGAVIDNSFPLIPRAEWSARIADKVREGSQLSDIRLRGNAGQPIPSRDQNGRGYCWAHSSTSALLILRACMNLPYSDLSAYAVACIIKGYADEGGWGAESMDFIVQRGVPSSQFWPQQSVSRGNDKPETWANAALHKVTEGFWDSGAAQYDRNASFEQEITLYLSNIPGVKDENWWSHSICGLDAVDGDQQRHATRDEISGKLLQLADFDAAWGMNDPVTAGIGVRIWNSWGDSWSDRGMGILTGNQAVSDGLVAPRAVTASAA